MTDTNVTPAVRHARLCKRFLNLIDASARNARHTQWWSTVWENPTPRTTRMAAINRAVIRTDKVGNAWLQRSIAALGKAEAMEFILRAGVA